ncbi:MAG: FtsB family cell division protein [Saprospiraceae bacterium]
MAKRLNPLQPLLDKVPAPLKNKYVLTLIVFFFILLFVNKINPWIQYKLGQTKLELEEEKIYYQNKLDEVTKDKQDSEKNVEKFAREKYYMKKDDEDVYIFVEEDKVKTEE